VTRKNTLAAFAVAVVLSLSLTACKDTKTLQENDQLKAQVAELQKENGQTGNDLETVTADRDALKKENEALRARMSTRKTKGSKRKYRNENIIADSAIKKFEATSAARTKTICDVFSVKKRRPEDENVRATTELQRSK